MLKDLSQHLDDYMEPLRFDNDAKNAWTCTVTYEQREALRQKIYEVEEFNNRLGGIVTAGIFGAVLLLGAGIGAAIMKFL